MKLKLNEVKQRLFGHLKVTFQAGKDTERVGSKRHISTKTGHSVTGVRAVRGKSEKEREMERAMEELKKAVVLETGDIAVASCCMGVSELSAAGKFLGSGVGEARKAVGQMETTVNRMV